MQDSIPPIGSYDVFRDVEKWNADQARYWTAALNQRAAAPHQVFLRKLLLEQSGIRSGDSVLELGCGTGRLLAELASAVGKTGHALGLEPQPEFVKEAENYILKQGLSANTWVILGSAGKIPLPDASIDICIAQTVLIHIPVAELPKVFTEIKRILKPGGRFISLDQDGDTWTIDHPQREITRKVIRFNSDYRYADGWTGRYLHRYFRENGFSGIRVQSCVHIDTEGDSYLHAMALRIAQAALEHKALTQEEYTGWERELERLTSAGDFFSSIGYFLCYGTKPA